MPPWKLLFAAGLPIGLSVYYVGWVAPTLVPLNPGVNVPFPAATRFLEDVSVWTGAHQGEVALIGLALLVSGLVARYVVATDRYYMALAIIVALTLGFVYLSISAPIDRLLHAVERSIPEDNRVPNHRVPAEE